MHPWLSFCCTWPSPCPSPHLLRGDTALPLPASCTHLMFLCRFSCGLVCSQALILFDSPGSPGSHTNCGFVSKRAISRETGSDKSKNRNLGRRMMNSGRAGLLLTHCLYTVLYTCQDHHDIQQEMSTRSRPSSTGDLAPVPNQGCQARLGDSIPGTYFKYSNSSMSTLSS